MRRAGEHREMNGQRAIKSIADFIEAVREDSSSWNLREWFRGEPESGTALVPTLYRGRFAQHENALLQMFRARASAYHDVVPIREHTDQWLFLARHAGVPTRLLDWSESALIALHFALKEDNPVIWMLNPLELNELSHTSSSQIREFPLVWHNPGLGLNPAFENLRGAWENDGPGVKLPLAIHPTYVHPRLRSQRACFTIHGKDKRGINSLVTCASILRRYVVEPNARQSMINELTLLGITRSVVFPDLDGLAAELKERFS
jgi:FRG domain